MTKYAFFLAGSLLACVGIYFLRRISFPALSEVTAMAIWRFICQPDLWIGTLFYGGAFLVFLLILNKYEASSAVPALLGTYLITVSIFSIVVFSEAVTVSKLIGYALIIGGVFLLS
jgi:multidrug transporter EmrE-like cation transporter